MKLAQLRERQTQSCITRVWTRSFCETKSGHAACNVFSTPVMISELLLLRSNNKRRTASRMPGEET
eukprot:1161128-Pelagomonas_calceolata.AAC.6